MMRSRATCTSARASAIVLPWSRTSDCAMSSAWAARLSAARRMMASRCLGEIFRHTSNPRCAAATASSRSAGLACGRSAMTEPSAGLITFSPGSPLRQFPSMNISSLGVGHARSPVRAMADPQGGVGSCGRVFGDRRPDAAGQPGRGAASCRRHPEYMGENNILWGGRQAPCGAHDRCSSWGAEKWSGVENGDGLRRRAKMTPGHAE